MFFEQFHILLITFMCMHVKASSVERLLNTVNQYVFHVILSFLVVTAARQSITSGHPIIMCYTGTLVILYDGQVVDLLHASWCSGTQLCAVEFFYVHCLPLREIL